MENKGTKGKIGKMRSLRSWGLTQKEIADRIKVKQQRVSDTFKDLRKKYLEKEK